MKEKVIEAAGKTWQFLGKNGETAVSDLPKFIKEKDEIVLQALGWLAREDKINYLNKNKRDIVALAESELGAFNSIIQNAQAQAQASQAEAKQKIKARSASRI
ncbi:MAG: hypothetical protein A2787_06700 [Omnitrophica WOR_2 bacterium RIFCSPHIGHO2_01_FULL_48_9]|nr:MAG: hypothetical protein A3D10_09585 [Omnitrophica WOR_2 bacterium RIFCSPHIGHO2_02_FULL_48_11]OGX29954.1 MAG: hypothetical protein A2787_06700 [Omnitrophica WOR_2 bacterium RIFCSPHIGHO2_01_FULL_48_9]